jgi:transposase
VRPPTHRRELTDDERTALEAGLRSPDAFVLRRCQIVLANARGESVQAIARAVGCSDQTVLNVLRAFDARRLDVLRRRSSRPRTVRAAFTPERAEALREVLHQSPHAFGKPSSLWTLELAAEVSFEQGLTAERVSDETVARMTSTPSSSQSGCEAAPPDELAGNALCNSKGSCYPQEEERHANRCRVVWSRIGDFNRTGRHLGLSGVRRGGQP